MQTHRDDEHLKALGDLLRITADDVARERWDALEREAERMRESGESKITAGDAGEEPLREWQMYGVHVREYPEREIDAPLDLVRVSMGGIAGEMGYLVFRGPVSEVKWVLRRALNALRDAPR